MACKQFRIFPITGWGNDGFPTLGNPVKPCVPASGSKEVVTSSLTATHASNSADLNADDVSEPLFAVTGYDLTVSLYGVDADFLAAIGLATKDAAGNLAFKTTNDVHVAAFVKGEDQKGKAYEYFFYDLVARPLDVSIQTKVAGQAADPIQLNFHGSPITTSAYGDIPWFKVLQGNTGYVSGEPAANDFYKGTAANSN
jgi:hypothetical protein